MDQDQKDIFNRLKKTPRDKAYSEEFLYSHDNPYHERLAEFKDFVLRDLEGEELRGKWQQDFFKRKAPIHVEIGTGFGDFMLSYCEKNPHINYVGMDYRFKRSYTVAKRLQQKLKDSDSAYCYLRAKGERLQYLFAESEVDEMYVFCPDPWPKKRHFKKRLFQAAFLDSVYSVLKPGGRLYVKTDQEGYFEWMKLVLEEEFATHKERPRFKILLETTDLWKEFPADGHFLTSFQTHFEKIFREQGVQIKAFVIESSKCP
jgi:tRNA (guanine-N7-)-methyltransferase